MNKIQFLAVCLILNCMFAMKTDGVLNIAIAAINMLMFGYAYFTQKSR